MQRFLTEHWLIIEWNVTERCCCFNKLLVEDKQVEEPNFDFNVLFWCQSIKYASFRHKQRTTRDELQHRKTRRLICKILITSQI